MLYEAMRAHLLADASIEAAVASEAIFPLRRPQDDDRLPCVVMQVIGDEPQTDLGGQDGGLLNTQMQLTCWAATFEAAEELAELVRSRLKTQASGSYGTFRSVVRDQRDLEDPAEDVLGRQIDVSTWFSPA